MYRVNYDEYVKCPKCGKNWQLLDWACALHQLSCPYPIIPIAEQERIIKNAHEHGIIIKFN